MMLGSSMTRSKHSGTPTKFVARSRPPLGYVNWKRPTRLSRDLKQDDVPGVSNLKKGDLPLRFARVIVIPGQRFPF